MIKEALYKYVEDVINKYLDQGFNCNKAIKESATGIKYISEEDSYAMIFIKQINSEMYACAVSGDYSKYDNKFYPFFVILSDGYNKLIEINISKLIISMVDMDNKYNTNVNYRLGLKENILKYKFMIRDKNYIKIALNKSNINEILNLLKVKDNITISKNDLTLNNEILLSEDENSKDFIAELVINGTTKKTLFKDKSMTKFYRFLEKKSLMLLLKKDEIEKVYQDTSISKNKYQIKKERKKRIEDSVNLLLDQYFYSIEQKALSIQAEEIDKLSELLCEQYDYNYKILEEMKDIIISQKDTSDLLKILKDGIDKKIECVNLLYKKTYLNKPRIYIGEKIFSYKNEDSIYKNIDCDIKPYVKSKFLYELDLLQYKTIQVDISENAKCFAEQIDELNEIVDEIIELKDKLLSNKLDKVELLEQIDKNKKKIDGINDVRLKSSYKIIHKFAKHLGFIPERQNGTSHLIYKKDSKSVVIPNKKGDIKNGLLREIIRQLGSSREEFLKFKSM